MILPAPAGDYSSRTMWNSSPGLLVWLRGVKRLPPVKLRIQQPVVACVVTAPSYSLGTVRLSCRKRRHTGRHERASATCPGTVSLSGVRVRSVRG